MEGKAPPPHLGSPTHSHLPPWAVSCCSFLSVLRSPPDGLSPSSTPPWLPFSPPLPLAFLEETPPCPEHGVQSRVWEADTGHECGGQSELEVRRRKKGLFDFSLGHCHSHLLSESQWDRVFNEMTSCWSRLAILCNHLPFPWPGPCALIPPMGARHRG